jgi:uncharacterized membrane protein YqiK
VSIHIYYTYSHSYIYHKFRGDGHFSVVVRCTVRPFVFRFLGGRSPSENPRITRLRNIKYYIYICTENSSQQLQMSREHVYTRYLHCTFVYIYIIIIIIIIFLYTRVYLTRVGETRLIRLDVMYTGRSTGSCLTVVSVDAYNIIRFRKT